MKLHLDRKYEIVQKNDYGIKILENGRTILYKSKDFSSEYTRDSDGNPLTYQDSDGCNYKYTRDDKGNPLTYQDSKDFSYEYTRDSYGNPLTYKNSDGDSCKWTYDDNGNVLTLTKDGVLIIDNRPKVTLKLNEEQIKIAKELGWL